MKKNIALFIGFVFLTSCIMYIPTDYETGLSSVEMESQGPRSELDVSYFYDYLSPHGIWVYHAPHGYIWIPNVDIRGWHPYTYGRWVWTDFGWTWVSSYRWGWVPFHYGRWGWDDFLGWFWVPDTVWGPAWVTWRRSDLYIGWAPLPPGTRFVSRVGIQSLPFEIGASYWVFVEGRNFMNPQLNRYMMSKERNSTIIRSTVIKTNIIDRNNKVVNEGIDIDTINKISKQKISKYELRESATPGPSKVRVEELEIYKPKVEKNETAKPKQVLNKEEAKEKIKKKKVKKGE